jgi:hypothetical protein
LRSSSAVFTEGTVGDQPESDQVWVSRRPLASSSSAKSRHRFARYSNISRVSGFVAVSASRSHSFARAQHSLGGVRAIGADIPLDALTERENVSSLCRKRRELSPIAAPKSGPTAPGKQPWLRVFFVDTVALLISP